MSHLVGRSTYLGFFNTITWVENVYLCIDDTKSREWIEDTMIWNFLHWGTKS